MPFVKCDKKDETEPTLEEIYTHPDQLMQG